MNDINALILLPRLQVQNANAVSGPFTWGFPPPTAFLGFVHALERKLSDTLSGGFGGIGIVCHHFDPQTTRPAGKRTQVLNLTRNPLGRDGKSAAIVEEGRAHMEVSLLLALRDELPLGIQEYFAEDLMDLAHGLRLAGGSLLPQRPEKRYQAQLIPLSGARETDAAEFRRLRHKLLPGFALVQREDRLAAHLAERRAIDPGADALDALLDLTRINVEPDIPGPKDPEKKGWGVRSRPGWLVPLPVGYAGISPLHAPGEVKGARDEETPFRFVESLYSLGEWLSPHRLHTLEQLLWEYQTDADNGLYLCRNRYSDFMTDTDTDLDKELNHG